MTWDVPTAQDCPVCGQTMFKKSGRGQMKPFCINPECSNFLPEDKRGYRKKPAASDETKPETAEDEKKPAKKTAAKSASKTTKKAASKTAAKKPAAKTTKKKTKAETTDE